MQNQKSNLKMTNQNLKKDKKIILHFNLSFNF